LSLSQKFKTVKNSGEVVLEIPSRRKEEFGKGMDGRRNFEIMHLV